MEIGSKIKSLRLKRGLTQEELGDRCELTKGYISQLENDLTSPSISTLSDIMTALGSSIYSLFSREDDRQIVFGSKDFPKKETAESTTYWLVPNSVKNQMEPLFTVLNPTSSTSEDMPHDGEEFGYVIEGQISLTVGEKKFVCKKGESFYYTCDKVHYISNDKDKQAKFIWVSSPPNF